MIPVPQWLANNLERGYVGTGSISTEYVMIRSLNKDTDTWGAVMDRLSAHENLCRNKSWIYKSLEDADVVESRARLLAAIVNFTMNKDKT